MAQAARGSWGGGQAGKRGRSPADRADTVLCVLITVGQFELDDDPGRVDRDTLWVLSTEAYWGRWRTRSVVEQQLESAWRVVGVYDSTTGTMVGFARAVSDGAGFAYLADVSIDKQSRGQGLGVELVATMIDRGPGAPFRWTLDTSDAHGLYERFGFTRPDRTYLDVLGRRAAPEPGTLQAWRRDAAGPGAGCDAGPGAGWAAGPGTPRDAPVHAVRLLRSNTRRSPIRVSHGS